MGIPLIESFNVATNVPIEQKMQVADLTDRDAIPSTERWEGMQVYCLAEGEGYILSGGITNSDWVKIFPMSNVPFEDIKNEMSFIGLSSFDSPNSHFLAYDFGSCYLFVLKVFGQSNSNVFEMTFPDRYKDNFSDTTTPNIIYIQNSTNIFGIGVTGFNLSTKGVTIFPFTSFNSTGTWPTSGIKRAQGGIYVIKQ